MQQPDPCAYGLSLILSSWSPGRGFTDWRPLPQPVHCWVSLRSSAVVSQVAHVRAETVCSPAERHRGGSRLHREDLEGEHGNHRLGSVEQPPAAAHRSPGHSRPAQQDFDGAHPARPEGQPQRRIQSRRRSKQQPLPLPEQHRQQPLRFECELGQLLQRIPAAAVGSLTNSGHRAEMLRVIHGTDVGKNKQLLGLFTRFMDSRGTTTAATAGCPAVGSGHATQGTEGGVFARLGAPGKHAANNRRRRARNRQRKRAAKQHY